MSKISDDIREAANIQDFDNTGLYLPGSTLRRWATHVDQLAARIERKEKLIDSKNERLRKMRERNSANLDSYIKLRNECSHLAELNRKLQEQLLSTPTTVHIVDPDLEAEIVKLQDIIEYQKSTVLDLRNERDHLRTMNERQARTIRDQGAELARVKLTLAQAWEVLKR